jgi:abortive infection bacteriophage resistance protein
MNSTLGKSEDKYKKNLETSRNIQKMDNFIQKDIHNSKLKFWGVTQILLEYGEIGLILTTSRSV